jgi:hypothetical protein
MSPALETKQLQTRAYGASRPFLGSLEWISL